MTTPVEPEQRFIITESQCRRIVGLNMHDNAQKLIKEIRMHPYPPKMVSKKDCPYLLRRGMSVLCIDSTDPPRKTTCDHCISLECFAQDTSAQQRIADAIKHLEKARGECGYLEDIDNEIDEAIALLRENQP